MLPVLNDRYRALELLDHGGMAKVFLARDRVTNDYVAVKVFDGGNAHDYVTKRRFVNEIKLTQTVQSPFVVKILDFHWDERIQFFVMEYLSGETLKARVKRKGPLSESEALFISKQIALGLESMHQVGIVHRDIKPHNIMVLARQRIKIIDLGIAKTDASEKLTKTGIIIASIHYVAPEVLRLAPPTPQVDIYALGMLLYYMVRGQVAFNDDSDTAIIDMHASAVLPHLESFSAPLAAVISKATAKKPERRFPSALAFYRALDVLSKIQSRK